MSKIEDLRKVKDQATKAIEKRQYDKAAELYIEIALRDPDPDWHQRAGEAYRRANNAPRAIEELSAAVDGYAQGGFLLKAIAVSKSILQVDPQHTATQGMLAELYARRDGAPVQRAPVAQERPMPAPLRPPGPAAAPHPIHLPVAQPVHVPVAAPVYPPPPVYPPAAHPAPVPIAAVAAILESRADAPIGALPLRHVLGGRRSEQIEVVDIESLVEVSDEAPPAMYEISLDDADLSFESAPAAVGAGRPAPATVPMMAEPAPVLAPLPPTRPAPVMAPPRPRPVVAPPVAAPPPVLEISGELDFGDLMEEPAAPVAAPKPIAAPPVAAPADEMDFGGLMEEPTIAAPPPAVSQAASMFPQIPLFSSLGESELRLLIDRMGMRMLDPGEAIVKEGERGGSLYIIVEGEVSVTVGPEQRELARLTDGAFFGEMGVLTDDPRSATVSATRLTQLLEISRELTWEIVRRSPEVLRTILRFFRDRMLDRLIGSSPMFSALSADDARGLASQFIFLELEQGVTPIKQGERAPGLFFLLCGEAEAVRDGVYLGTLRPGDVFGELSMLLRSPATANVRAVKKCWALELPQARFQEIMMTYPQVLAYVSELGEQRRARLEAPAEGEGRDNRVAMP